MSTEELDSQLVSTLREIDPHNYVYLFERCKTCNVDARHLRFFKKDQIHELIPKSELGILAEFEYLLNLWQISKGYTSLNAKIQLNRDNESNNLISPKLKPQAQSNLITVKEEPHILSNNQPVVVATQSIDIKPSPINSQGHQISSQATVVDKPEVLLTVLHSNENSKISNAKRMKFEEDDEEEFTLETIIPELLKELKDSYESKNSLSRIQRRLLCRSIVDYFVSRKIEFSSYTMDDLAEQIVEHFPKEDKKTWCNRDGRRTRGRLIFRLRYSRLKIAKQTTNTSTSKVATYPTSSEDENSKISNAMQIKFEENDEEKFTLEIIIPELLKNLKDSYESKNSLSTTERRLLCSSIVDYFESSKIKFSSYTMDELAEQIVQHFPTEDKKSWHNRDGPYPRGRLFFRVQYIHRNTSKKSNNTSTSKVLISQDECDEEKFTLETIIPELLKELKDSYESKEFLSRNERSLLCSSIVDYFKSRKIKFSSYTMDDLAEQIVQHFPTEDKKSWCNRNGAKTSGRLIFRLRNSRRNMAKQTSTNSISSDNECDEEEFTLETIIPELLKELKDSYESKNLLSTNERRFLCSSIVDYFESRKIKFSSETMDELAEQIVEHFPTEDKKSWCNCNGAKISGRLIFRLRNSRRNMAKQTSTNSISSDNECDEEEFTLETIIPELLKNLKDSYESKDSLSENQCRLLCSSIVDYFESKKIKFSSYTMDDLAEQIVEHFPTEDKKSWCNRDALRTCGRFYSRLHNLRRNIAKQTNNTSASKVVTNSTSSEDESSKTSNAKRMKFEEDDEEKFTLETIIPELLMELKDSYELKNSLSTNERRFLCSSIVDYFVSRKIEFSSYTMDELAEQIVEHFPTEDKKSWCKRNAARTSGRLVFRLRNSSRNMAKQTSTNSISSEDEEEFTLETIIPELLKELKDSYESKDSLSENERRLLCRSIVDYFQSREIKFSLITMDELTEQIVQHFPTEDKKSWCNRNGPDTRGRLLFRLRYLRKKKAKQTSTNSTSSEDECDEEEFTLETIIPELLKELKDSYESKEFLSRNERSLLCSSIVDYFESRKIIFSSYTMDDLAEQIVEHFPTEDKKSWCNRNAAKTSGRLVFRLRNSRRNMAKQTSTNSISSEDEDDEEKFTLETIIPELLKELKDSYESKDSLSENERRLLCRSIVDYFQSTEIKFSSDTMDDLAEQIVQHFPTEDKKSWCSSDRRRTCGRFFVRVHYLRRNIPKQINNTSTLNITLETIIPELLKNLKDSYESKEFLSRNERNLLCSSIVDYFVSRNIKFSSDTMDELAEQIVEHFPTEDKKSWCNRGRFYFYLRYLRKKKAKQTSTNSTSSDDEYDEEQFTLEIIIPELLKELKDSYESKEFLSKNERSLLCSSIVDYCVSRNIKLSSDTMNELAEQIVQHFPTEDKKSWYNRDGPDPRGRLLFRLCNSRRNIPKETNNTSTSTVVTNSTSREPESLEDVHDEDSKSIQAWLKSHKCENFSEIMDLWEDTMKYRCWQTQNLKDLKSIREFLNNWPSYKLETGHELLTMDFRYFYPQAMETFRTRWLIYKQNIEKFLKVKLKDVYCTKLLEKYQLRKAATNEDSSSCILIYLVHAITKPFRHFEAVNDNVSSAITDSQHSMMRLIRDKAEIDEYTEPYPCIFVVGDSMLEVQECYVVFMDLHYKLSYENCLAVCVQIFTVLKVEFSPASQCFWEFIRGYLFNIAKDKEKFNLATKNMVNYLETVASSV